MELLKKLIEEQYELNIKLNKLAALIESESFNNVDDQHKVLLKSQLRAMEDYSIALQKRVMYLKGLK